MLVHWSETQEIYFLSWWASELHRNHLTWYQSHPASFSGVLDEIWTMTPLTFNVCIYQHSGACCQAAFWVYLSILTTWVQTLEPIVEGETYADLLSSRAGLPLSFVCAFLPIRDDATVPPIMRPFCKLLIVPRVCYSLNDRTTCSLFRSQTEFILNDFILISLFRKFNCLLKFSLSNNLLTQDLLQELDLPRLPIHYWGLPRTPWGKGCILHWIRIPGLDFINNLREMEKKMIC